MNEYDVVIRMSEPRYWVLLAGSLLAGWALIRRFQSIDEVVKDRALKQLGGVLLLLQVGYQGWMLFDETFDWTIHRSLPLHFCGINIWLVALNCFWRNPTVYLFTAFMGTIGGAHAILTPQLTVGDDMPILIHYYINHASWWWSHHHDIQIWDEVSKMGVDVWLRHGCWIECCHDRNQPVAQYLLPCRSLGELHVHDRASEGRQPFCVSRTRMAVVHLALTCGLDPSPYCIECVVSMEVPRSGLTWLEVVELG